MRKRAIRVGGVPEHFNLPWFAAEQEGGFAEHRLRVSYREYPGGTGAMTQALSQNKLDMAVVLSEGAVAHAVTQQDCFLVKVFVRSPLIWGIHVGHKSKLTRIRDVRGARYAISRYGSGSHLMAIVDAARRGWPTDALRFVLVNNLVGAQEALTRGTADVFFWERFITQPLVDAKVFRRIGQRPTPWPCFMISVRRSLLERRGEEVRQVLSVVEKFAQKLQRRTSTVDWIVDKYGLKSRDAKAWFDAVRWATGFSYPRSAMNEIVQALASLDVIAKKNPQKSDIWRRL